MSLIIEVFVLIIYIVFTITMVSFFKVNVTVVWMVEILYGLLLAVFSFAYLKSKRWMGKEV